MPGKVFISCGQANSNEINVAKKLETWFKEEGFIPYVAIQTQSINDVNSGIIGNLKDSDYYVFINFRRDKLSLFKINKTYRGSLFTNQELAIAYYLGFERAIFFEQRGVKREGLLNYMIANSIPFNNYIDIIDLVTDAVKKRNWDPNYSRHLIIGDLTWHPDTIWYNDNYGNHYQGKVLNLTIINQRKDIPAFKSQIRLDYIECNGDKSPSSDKSPIKCAGQPGFDQVIWPGSYSTFSILLQDEKNPMHIYLLSSLDVNPKSPIIKTSGNYKLYFSVLAENFPILNIIIELTNEGIYDNIKINISNGA